MSKFILVSRGPTMRQSGYNMAALHAAVLVYFPHPDGSAKVIKYRHGPMGPYTAEELKAAIEHVKSKYPEPEYPPNAKTLDEIIKEIRDVFSHPDWRFVKYSVSGVTPKPDNSKIELAFDAKKVVSKK